MTNRKGAAALVWTLVMILGAGILDACTKKNSQPQVVVEIPAGFSGNFQLEMGVRNAPPLPMQNNSYLIAVPRAGKLTTSTLLEIPKVTFKNDSEGSVWGYSHSVFTTGDGISVGGTIEFFVGTKTQYDAEQNRKNHSGALSTPLEFDFAS
jgi:hypothetical protein